MIRDFWVKNYLSIRDKQELSFVAKGPSSELVTEVADGVFLYKLGILYGSNASGKSNMLIAMNEVFRLLVIPKSDATVEIGGCIPFVLTKDEPTEMHVSFYADGTRYDYDVKFNGKHILSETLYYYPNKSKSLFYERSFVGENVQADIKFGASLKLQVKTQESIRENTLNNHSVLSVCRKAALKEDIAPFNALHTWIMDNYHEIDGDGDKGIVEILKDAYSNPKKRKFFVPNDFRERIQKENIPEEMKDVLLKPTTDSITFWNHSDNGDFDIPLRWQSKGTQKYIRILDALYDLITSPHVYYLDELGEDLHNDLLYYYLNVFIFNSDKSQLVITSQETTLLSQDMINENRGVVWFVEKNKETASSYRIGRLGAKPELGSIFINLED